MTPPGAASWITAGPRGIFVSPGGFHIDPTGAVDCAVITHGHGDHARPGHRKVLATSRTLAVMNIRLGRRSGKRQHALGYFEPVTIGDVRVWLAPAGHVLGSAQVALEFQGTRVVVSGDYKRRPDPTCDGFEPVACDVFITEATFGLPVYRHPDDQGEIARLLRSLTLFPDRCHLMSAYSFGKAQRLIALLRAAGHDGPVHVDDATLRMCEVYRRFGIELGVVLPVEAAVARGSGLAGELVLHAQPARIAGMLADPVMVAASGWLGLAGGARGRGVELPLVISDHADWDELHRTFRDVGAPEVWVTHGRGDAIVHQAARDGIRARELADAASSP